MRLVRLAGRTRFLLQALCQTTAIQVGRMGSTLWTYSRLVVHFLTILCLRYATKVGRIDGAKAMKNTIRASRPRGMMRTTRPSIGVTLSMLLWISFFPNAMPCQVIQAYLCTTTYEKRIMVTQSPRYFWC